MAPSVTRSGLFARQPKPTGSALFGQPVHLSGDLGRIFLLEEVLAREHGCIFQPGGQLWQDAVAVRPNPATCADEPVHRCLYLTVQNGSGRLDMAAALSPTLARQSPDPGVVLRGDTCWPWPEKREWSCGVIDPVETSEGKANDH